MNKNTMLDYYKSKNIIAVAYKNGELNTHFSQRKNLLQNHLSLPLIYFKGAKVLEFGPNGGENSLFLALNGSQITLVEPDTSLHQRILDLYRDIDGIDAGGLNDLSSHTIESFFSSTSYDFVLAEGFLHALDHRYQMIKKMADLSRRFIVLTYICPWGAFNEAVKRFVFKRVLEIKFGVDNAELPFESVLIVAEDFFYEDFRNLGTVRTFESWVRDVLLNPCCQSKMLDKFDDLIEWIRGFKFEFHGSSPAWDTRNMWEWYKIKSSKDVVEEWRSNLSFFITGSTSQIVCAEDLSSISSLTGMLFDYSSNQCSINLDDIQYGVKNLSNDFFYIKKITSLLLDGDYLNILSYYKSHSGFRLWGMPQHYLCARKIA
jgi:hypothetical protein